MTRSKSIKFEYDRDTDAAYLTLRRGKVIDSEEVETGLIVDVGPNDQIIGVEILRFTRRFRPQTKKLAS
jgi:uncharacterized protein YuzE